MALFSEGLLRDRYFAKSYNFPGDIETNLRTNARAAPLTKKYDIFMSHSFLDAKVIAGLKTFIEDIGYSVYVDWVDDSDLDRNEVTREAAKRVKLRMANCQSLFYATSSNAKASKWMPWECGLFDGLKQKVAICPVVSASTTMSEKEDYKGSEYLGLYPYVVPGKSIQGGEKLWIHESPKKYVEFSGWLKGQIPTERN